MSETRKPIEDQRTRFLRVRLTVEQDAQIKAAAKNAGITVSAWVQERLTKAARDERRRTVAEERAPTVNRPVGAPSDKPE